MAILCSFYENFYRSLESFWVVKYMKEGDIFSFMGIEGMVFIDYVLGFFLFSVYIFLNVV